MFPEGCDESLSALAAPEFGPREGAELREILGTEIRHLVLFPVRPEVFDRVELRSIGREEFKLNLAALSVDPGAHQTAAMDLQTIPDDEQLAADQVPPQVSEEVEDLGGTDAALDQLEVYVPEGDAGDSRELVPGETVLQDRGVTSGRPGSHAVRPFTDPGLVYEDDGSALPGAVFLMLASASSSTAEWRIRPVGRRDQSVVGRKSSAP